MNEVDKRVELARQLVAETRLVSHMFDLARRNALHVDKAIEEALQGLRRS